MSYLRFFPTLFGWWYSEGLNSLFDFLSALFSHMSELFSPVDLMANLFAPWKRIAGQKGRGLDAFKEWLADNLISRLIGFVMRLGLIAVYLVFLIGFALFLALSIVYWLLMPFLLFLAFIFIFI